MKIFVDESGDSGVKFDRGSTTHLLVTAVFFSSHENAEFCTSRIVELRRKLGLKSTKEFHFNKDSESIRREFLEAVSNIEFRYVTSVLDKRKIKKDELQQGKQLYQFATRNAFGLLPQEVIDASVVIDQCGGRDFTNQLKTFLRQSIDARDGARVIKRMSSAHSHSNDLLQLADMVCGAVARSFSERNFTDMFRSILKRQEHSVAVWPEEIDL